MSELNEMQTGQIQQPYSTVDNNTTVHAVEGTTLEDISSQVGTHSWLRLEDDDDSSIDLLTSTKTESEGKIGLGDVFTGHKQIKRCWLINDNDQLSFDVKISLDWSKQIRVIVGEVCIDSTGLVLPQIDELPNRPQCVSQYKKLAKQAMLPIGVALEQSFLKQVEPALPVAAVSQQEPLQQSVIEDVALVAPSALPEPPFGGTAEVLEVAAQVLTDSSLTANDLAPSAASVGPSAAVKNVRKLPSGLPKEKSNSSISWASFGSNLNPDTESDALVGWEQLKDGSGGGAGSNVAGNSSGSLGKARRTVSGTRVSQSLSYLCGRQWGQDGVSAELCGAASGADFEGSGGGQDATDPEFEYIRPFIGATSRAVRASRATKSFAKLNNMKPPTMEKKKKLPREVDMGTLDLPALNSTTAPLSTVEDRTHILGAMQISSQDSFDHFRRLRSADSRSASLVEDVEETLLSIVLKPSERVQVTFVVCPSPHYIDDTTGGSVGGKLVDRDIPLLLSWKRTFPGLGDVEADNDTICAGRHRLALHFRACASLISVVPSTMSVYELGMCSVGEHRTVALEVRNDSDLPTIVFPLVESDVLDLSDLEVRIPPQETRQIKVGFLAKTEDAEYWDKVVFLNGYNAEASKVVQLKSRNVDTQQVLLHSMFYKLVTYNNLRQLQVHFDRCLINMPNLRIFSIKNVHSKPLRLNVCWNAKSGIRLFLVVAMSSPTIGRDSTKSDASSVAPSKSTKGSGEFLSGPGPVMLPLVEGDVVQEMEGDPASKLKVGGEKGRLGSSQQQDDIEDMKWGDNPHDLGKFGKYRRSMSMQAVKYLPTGNGGGGGSGIESHVGMSGDDLSVNYGKGAMYEGKSGVSNSSRDLLSVLDLSQSTLPAVTSNNNTHSTSVSVESGEEKLSMSGRRSNSEGGGKEVRFKLLPSIGEHGEPGVSTPQSLTTPGSFRSNAQDETVDLFLRQFDNEEFPFSFLEESDPVEGGAANAISADGRRNKTFFDDGGASDLRKVALRSKDRPHSIGGSTLNTFAPSAGSGTQLGAAAGIAEPAAREREKSEAEKRVKRVQKAYADLRYMIDNAGDEEKSGLRELQPNACPVFPAAENANSEISVSVEIPVATSYRFALLYEPQQRAGAEDIEEYMQVQKSEEVHILLPDMNATDVSSSLDLNSILYDTSASHMPDDVPLHPHSMHDGGLRPRSLPIRASLVRSEMVVIQKNISFGRTVLGEKSSRGVTVVNRSSVPCLYTISKSGSISSGFLQVPGGRKGLIPAFSSKVIEFIFRPTLPGNFEEVLLINNVLNPRDTQTVTIKAKVSHTETFVISPIEPSPTLLAGHTEEPFASEVSSIYKSQLDDLLNSNVESSNVKSLSCYLGSGVVGDSSSLNLSSGASCTQLCFRIKNVTSKSRQFIVDATHVHAVELLVVASPPVSSPVAVDPKAQLFPDQEFTSLSDAHITFAAPIVSPSFSPVQHPDLVATTPFEPIPEVLQSVLSLRCRFSSELLQSKSASNADGKDGSLSADERKALEDSLEQFQQKLKIAIRKNKPEKIEKYQKKIDKVILSLQSNKKATSAQPEIAEVGGGEAEVSATSVPADLNEESASTAVVSAGAPVPDVELSADVHIAPDVLLPIDVPAEPGVISEEPLASSVAPIGIHQSEESEVSYHFQLEPEQERIVRITMSFLPGAGYRYWTGVLPFHGFLRIFECKNEDHIKVVRYGALIQSTRLALPAVAALPVGSSVQSEVGLVSERNEGNNNSLSVISNAKMSPFLATVAQWSSLPTRDIYPKYRQLPQNLLPMCVKLVRASRDRVMHGSLSIASLVEQSGTLCLSIDEGFSAKVSSEYSTYNSKRHGSIHFVVALSAQNATSNSVDDIEGSSAASNADDEIEAGQRTAVNCDSLSALAAGSKVDFSIQWRPPLDIGGVKVPASNLEGIPEESGSGSSTSASLRIIGAVKAQLKIGDQVVGTSLSIPFIGVLEHTSVLAVSKYFTFEEVSVGSYRTAQIPIANTSATEELHYIVSSEEVATACKAMGTVDIVSGQTGIIPPNGTKQLQLLISASAAGKYEQKLWIRNIRDSFDQKRIVIQANVSLAQTKFVVFPDLETVSNSFGKYKPIDLGLVQIQSAEGAETILPLLPPLDQRCYYELRIQNVSGKSLCVTAVSNLKSQCFIYGDDNLSQLAIYCPLPVSVLTTLYVVIRPAVVPSGNQLMSHAEGMQSASEDGQVLAESVALEGKAKPSAGGRDLVGGIKLVFFPTEYTSVPSTPRDEDGGGRAAADDEQQSTPMTPSPFSLEASPRKLFETAISFRATVGKSTLTLKAPDGCELQHVTTASASAPLQDHFLGRFELKNLSKLFPIEYAYILAAGEECAGLGTEGTNHQTQVLSALTLLSPPKKGELQIRILDERINLLAPGESRWVTYIARHPSQAAGVALYPVRVANTSTMEVSSLSLAIFLDSDRPTFPTVEEAVSEKSNQHQCERDDIELWTNPKATPLKPIPCNAAIWVYQHNYQKIGELAAVASIKAASAVGNAENVPAAAVVDINDQDNATTDPLPTNSVHFLVQGTSGGELCTWTYFNDKSKSITFFPASDLPVNVTLSTVATSATASLLGGDEADAVSRPTGTSPTSMGMSGSASSAYSRKISPALLRWRKSLKRCGGAFTVEAGGTVKVSVSARRGAALSEEQLAALGGTRRLEAGKGGQLQGVVVFLQASHSLQSLFDATPLKDKEKPKEPVAAGVSSAKIPGPSKDDTSKGASSLKGKAGPNARILSEILTDQIEILPIMSISTLSCAIAVPLLSLPGSDVALGRKRCGQFTRFEFSVENPSDIDVPCCIDNLPAWMKIERFQTSLLAKKHASSGENSEVADSDVNSLVTEPFLDLSNSAAILDSHSHSEWISPRRVDIKAGKTEKSLGAQKLHWWLTTNGATISNQQALSPAFATSGDKERESESRGPRHRRGSKESITVSEVLSIGEGTWFSTNATEDDNQHSPSRGGGEFSDERFLERHSSLEVNHEHFLLHYQRDLTLEAHELGLFQLHQSLIQDADDSFVARMKLFAVPAKSRVRLTVVVQVPVLPESELLQHSVRIKNLATAVISSQQLVAGRTAEGSGRYVLDREGSVLVTDVQELAVRLQVDATRALELIAAIDEPFVMLAAPEDQKESRSSAYMRLLKDPFLVPPPVEVSIVPPSTDDEASVSFPMTVNAKSKVSKAHCRFSIKNKLASSLRVQATVTLNPEIINLLDMKVKFQTNNSSVIDLEPEEACAVKIRVLPKLEGRMHGLFLSPAPLLASTGMGGEEGKKKVTIQVEDGGTGRTKDSERSGEGVGTRSELKKANSRNDMIAVDPVIKENSTGHPILLGTVRISPSVSRPPSSLGWDPIYDADHDADEALHSQDTLVLSILGYLQPSPTVTTSLTVPVVPSGPNTDSDTLPLPSFLEFKSVVSDMSSSFSAGKDLACAVSPTHAVPSEPVATQETESPFTLIDPKTHTNNRILPPQPQKSFSVASVSPMLALANNGLSFCISNPSTGCDLNFAIKTQTYRHAGMRLQLSGAAEQAPTDEDAYDTFFLEATPSHGTLGPSSLSRINLRLIPGDSSVAVKTSTTLTADIPDVHMRERRLRSHHGRDHAASSGNVLTSGSSSNVPILTAVTGIAGVGIASESDSIALEGGLTATAEKEIVQVSNKPAGSFNGPFTLACMPIEVWDCDFPAHPPKVVHAYLTCEVPLPVLVTQGLRDAPRQKSQSFHTPDPDILVVLPSAQNIEAVHPVAPDPLVIPSDVRLVQLRGEELVALDQGDGEASVCNLNVGQQVQRKEALEWPLLLENASIEKPISYSISTVFPGDVDNWVSLGQSGGVLLPNSQTSLMIYFRRSVPPGVYVTYLIVENREFRSDCVVLRVSMEVVLDAKRASVMSSMASLAQLSSATSLTSKRERPSEDNLPTLVHAVSTNALTENLAQPVSAPSPTVFSPIDIQIGDASAVPTPTQPTPPRVVASVVRPVFQLCAVSKEVQDGNGKEAAAGDGDEAYRAWDGIASASPVGLSLSPQASPDTYSSGKRMEAAAPRRQKTEDRLGEDAASVALMLRNLTDVTLELNIQCELSNTIHPDLIALSAGGDRAIVGVPGVPSDSSRTALIFTLSVPPRDSIRIHLQDPVEGAVLALCDPSASDEQGADVGVDGGEFCVAGKLTVECRRFEHQTQSARILMH